MALSKNSIYGIGVLVSLASVLAATFLGVMPLVNQANTAQEETKTLEQSNVAKQARIELLEAGSADYDNIVDYVNTFLRQAPSSVDVAGLSTAVSAAVQKSTSVEIVSFNFLDQEPVTDRVPPEVSLEGQGGQVSPFDVEAAAPAATTATGGTAEAEPVDPFQRIPVTIEVSAPSVEAVATFADELARQERLITVINITTNSAGVGADGDLGGATSATIYAYAFTYDPSAGDAGTGASNETTPGATTPAE